MRNDGGKRFVKKIPASAMAPAFKLSLPFEVVCKHLSHLVGRDFELATSADTSQCWTGAIQARRNKERSEYTLKGWRLFAEADSVQVGDHLSFELVRPNRLVVQNISRQGALQAPVPPPSEVLSPTLSPPSASRSSTAPVLAPAMFGTAPDIKPFDDMPPATDVPGLLETVMEEAEMPASSASMEQSTASWCMMADWLDQASAASNTQAPSSAGMAMAVDEPLALGSAPSWTDMPDLRQPTHPCASDPVVPHVPRSGSDHLLVPHSEPNTGALGAKRAVTFAQPSSPTLLPSNGLAGGLHGPLGPVPPMVPMTTQGTGTPLLSPANLATQTSLGQNSLRSSTGSGQVDASGGPAMRSLQNDVKRFELRAERAERQEVMLHSLLASLRGELNKCLHASTGLERAMQGMSAEDAALVAEMQGHCRTIKTTLWRCISTDI